MFDLNKRGTHYTTEASEKIFFYTENHVFSYLSDVTLANDELLWLLKSVGINISSSC